jgi:orotate phosphoribosyltransferase
LRIEPSENPAGFGDERRYDTQSRGAIRMRGYKTEFLELALELGVLRFGEFTLKSGRVSPYFFNAGLFNSGYAAAKLARCYASAVAALDVEFDMLFGPAYKGIPLVVLSAAALAEHHDRDYPFAFNRKERKDHGEGGAIIGAPLTGRVLILDDVITAGTAIREVLELIRGAGAKPAGVLVALDREEVGVKTRVSAVQQLEAELGVPIRSIVTLTDLIDHMEEDGEFADHLPSVRAYRNRYGMVLDG